MFKYFLEFKNFLSKYFSENKLLLQDKHSFKPMLIEIEDRPVNPLGNFILWTIVVAFFIVVLWLSLAKVDVVVSSRGILIPSGDIQTIQSTYNGVIKKFLVKEGDNVKEGQTLITLDTSILDNQIKQKEQQYDMVLIKIEKLNSLLNKKDFIYNKKFDYNKYEIELQSYLSEKNALMKKLQSYAEKINEIQQKIKIMKINMQNKNIEYKKELAKLTNYQKVKDIIPRLEYENSVSKVEILKNEFKSYGNNIIMLTSNLNDLENQKNFVIFSKEAKYLDSLIQLKKLKSDLLSEINILKLQKKKYKIVSPSSGYVLKLNINTKEAVVTSAQKLMTLVPENVKLYAKVDVLNKDIGYIKDKMKGVIKIDTYDFQKYGTIDGKIIKISNSSIEKKNIGAIYEVIIELDKDYLIISGNKQKMKPGMTITTELKVGKRKIIEFFIYPAIKYFREGTSVI